MSTLRRQPVSRWRVALGALVAGLLLAGVVAGSEWLRPGSGPFGRIGPDLDADPRIAVDCANAPAEDGQHDTRPARGGGRAALVGSAALYDCPARWNGRAVRFRGEVVGAVLQRGELSWLQLNDDVYAGALGPLPAHRDLRGGNAGVGALVPTTAIGAIRHVGGPRWRGDIVEVTGVFHRVEPESGEIAVIRAEALRVLRAGARSPRPVETRRVVVAGFTTAIALGLLGAEGWRRRRMLAR